ncbi:MAG: glycosyl hydrolase [Bacteroidia bacterium]|nr:glycosyl hydrolase [Bacteroidia bacterium]
MRLNPVTICLLALALCLPAASLRAQKPKPKADSPAETPKEEPKKLLSSSTVSGLKFRSVGPALTSGRIIDLAVNPANRAEYYIAVASGGVWKTVNNGTTFEPLFDSQGSYSIGCVALDPGNPHVVWVGTGENNAQRSVAYGDGVYKSEDGGKSWKHMGLKASEHIGRIVVDPRNSQTVFVAAQGPLWSPGGDRGLYKSSDGGKNWRKVLDISPNTGVNEVIIDPRNPDILYASAWQRRRHVWTLIAGGPESALYKSTDGGETWDKLSAGLPSGDVGRIGLAISPVNPDVVYAIIEASGDAGGFFRSQNRGASWEKRSSTSTSGNYYQEIFCDPVHADRVYVMDMLIRVTDDGGKTFRPLGEKFKHVDNHALWIDPKFPDYYLAGCDGGIYESYDRGQNWHFKSNLPVTQFYKVTTDNALPFYNIYGGTQDNYSLGGPSRTLNGHGISNADWFVTLGGDGFESAVDPENPDIVYSQYQYGNLYRFDKRSGEQLYIQPQPGKDEPALRWNWDSPLIISPHSPTRLYFAANRLFRSDDRGNSWTAVSPDLTRQIDRNTLPVMDRVWGMDAVAKNASTSFYGNITALAESPKAAGVLYVGTDDGLIQVSEDGGGTWRRIESVPGVPERTYVNMIIASLHDANTLYAAFNNHKNGDFKPYLFKSGDRGRTWTAIQGNLPERGSVYSIAQDHVNPDLLFAGTEFGVFFTADGGKEWIQLKGGLPTIAVRDLDIQRRENDLVLATFGRGFYILDDYTPLRGLSKETLEKEAALFPVKDALMFHPATPLGDADKSFQGESYFTAPNPPVGAVFTYYLKEGIKTRKELRKEAEKKLTDAKQPVPYPSAAEIRAEDEEEAPYLLLTVTDAQGAVVTRIRAGASAGVARAVWNFRYPPVTPVNPSSTEAPSGGYMALPGTYSVSLSKVVNGVPSELAGPQPFVIKPLNHAVLPAPDRAAVLAFQDEVSDLRRAVFGAVSLRGELEQKVKSLKSALLQTPAAPVALMQQVKSLEGRLMDVQRALTGDASLARREFPQPPAIVNRVEDIVYGLWYNSSAPTQTQRDGLRIAGEAFGPVQAQLKTLLADIAQLEQQFEAAGAPYTPGRLPEWKKN